VLRNLGIARLELGRPADAIPVLERARRVDGSPVTSMLAARARALSGDPAGARPLYRKALAAAAPGIEVALDWAASELGRGGDPAIAVAALEHTAGAARSSPLAARHQAALATARHAAGIAALRAGQGARAVELLRAAAAAAPSLAVACDLALAAVAAGDAAAARAALRAVSGQRCPFPPPADTQAAPILIAFTEGLSARGAGRALSKLAALAGKAAGPAAALRATALRVVALEAARGAYEAGAIARAKRHLQAARAARTRVGADELAHDLAVIDLAEGRVDASIAALEKLAPRLPDALVPLGIAHEKRGEPGKALDAWRRARKAGVRSAPLAEWIEAKERIYGAAP
jgi:tetratricopeptide (TPR) repeat protein